MTTRRVILLVLLIMLALPCFTTELYGIGESDSASYGADIMYHRWCKSLQSFGLKPGSSENFSASSYLRSSQRRGYEDELLLYTYYHNWFCHEDANLPDGGVVTPKDSLGRLFWLGANGEHDWTEFFLLKNRTYDLNARWNRKDAGFYSCDLPPAVQAKLFTPWNELDTCIYGVFKGISLIKDEEPLLDCPEHLRYNERTVIFPQDTGLQECGDATFIYVFDRRVGSRLEAILGASQTLFICFLLGFGAMTFSHDANRLVLMPIERMISKLEKIRSCPLQAVTISEEENFRENAKRYFGAHGHEEVAMLAGHAVSMDMTSQAGDGQEKKGLLKRCWNFLFCKKEKGASKEQEPLETVVLEKTIIKIGSLLTLSLGEGGSDVMERTLKSNDSTTLNVFTRGRKINVVVASCGVRNFMDVCDVLKTSAIIFVNRITNIVHLVANEYCALSNRSIGENYLLVWHLQTWDGDYMPRRMADLALACVAEITARLAKSPLVAEYKSDRDLNTRFKGNFRVRMDFGTHSGWAIECAIGSEFKIDVSYLSPHVTMASQLERAAREYGRPILISEAHRNLMSPEIQEQLRLIDTVTMPVAPSEPAAINGPMKLYCLDLDDAVIEVDYKGKSSVAWPTRGARFKMKLDRMKKRQERTVEDFETNCFFDPSKDTDIGRMRRRYTSQFFNVFAMGYVNFVAGEWEYARRIFQETVEYLNVEDRPSAVLLRFMRKHEWTPPKDWIGVRPLPQS